MVKASAITHAIVPPNIRIKFVETDKEKDGMLSNTGQSMLQGWFKNLNGLTPTISCECTNVGDVYTLTPLNISPIVLEYYSFASFAFVASGTSGGATTATVVPNTGSLPTLPILKTHGSAPAAGGDLTSGLFYVMYYVDTLNGGNGAFVLV